MMVKWSESSKESIRLRLARGETPAEIKASFNRMVDRLSGKVMPATLTEAIDEIKRLRHSIRSMKGAVTRKMGETNGTPKEEPDEV